MAGKNKCDKCGQPVPFENDAVIIQSYIVEQRKGRDAAMIGILGTKSRHFLPVYNVEGVMTCEGSPSRAQYIEGQPRDSRGFIYHPEREQIYRDAYAKAQEEARKKAEKNV